MAIDVEMYYRRYAPMVVRRCRMFLRNEEEALDAMQEVFVKLIRNQNRLQDDNPSSLLMRMATNECLNRIRSSKRKPADLDDDLIARIADATDERKRFFAKSALEQLFQGEKEKTATIAVMHLLDGFTLEETAKEVGMSVSGVRKRLRGLKSRIKELAEVE